MKRRILSVLMALLVATAMIPGGSVLAFGAVTDAKPPTSGAEKWAVKPGGSMTPPALYENKLYVASGRYVYMVNKDSGAVIRKSVPLAGSLGYTTVPVTCAAGKVFVPVTGGKVDILDASGLGRIRTVGGFPGQTITPIIYKDGYFYTGTYTPSGGDGTYMCINAATGEIRWTQANPHGYYWAGACTINGRVIFGSEDGKPDGQPGDAKLYSRPAGDASGAEHELLLAGSGDIRSTIVYDGPTDCVYFTSKNGALYKVKVGRDGALTLIDHVALGGASTSTPVIYGGKAYVGVDGGSLNGTGSVKAVDLSSMTITGAAGTPGYVQGEMLLSTAYGAPYLYAAYNYPPGGLYLINGSGMSGSGFFTPPGARRQYGISQVICDHSGTIYYTNDSNYLMAVSSPVRITSSAGKGGKITGSRTVGKGAPSCKFTATPNKHFYVSRLTVDGKSQGKKTSYTFYNITADHSIKAYFKKVSAPVKVRAKAGKKRAIVKWKRVKNVNGYQVYRAAKKAGKYKRVKTITKAKTTKFTNKKLKKSKRYYYKVRAYKNVNGKKVYSAFSKKVRVKTK